MNDEKMIVALNYVIDSLNLPVDMLFNIGEDGQVKDIVFLDDMMRELSIIDVLLMIDNELEPDDHEMLEELLLLYEFMKKMKSYDHKSDSFFDKRMALHIAIFNEEMQKQVLRSF